MGSMLRRLLWLAILCYQVVTALSPDELQCHLKPFGCHKPPSVEVTEFTVDNAPSPEEFYSKYVSQSKPVIFRSAVSRSVASQKWSDEYIRENFGDMEVRLEAKNEKTHMPPKGERYLGRDTLRHFIDTYHEDKNNVYIVSDLPEVMYKDVAVIPSFGPCGQMARRIVEVDIWWSGGGTTSIIHKDEFNQINCLINGTKDWKLIEPKFQRYLYKHEEPEYELGGFSDIDPTAVDLKKYPDVTKIEWSNFTVHAGDCLFLPKSYYHLVASSGTHNMAVSILFSRFDGVQSLDFTDCVNGSDMQSLTPLSELDVQWRWKGKGTLVMGRQDLEERYRKIFAQAVAREGGRVDHNGLLKIIEEKFTPEDIIMRYGDVNDIEPYEPSAVYIFEYSVVPFERVWWAMKSCLERHDVITIDIWMQYYLQLSGTREFGQEVFRKLSKGNTAVTSSKVTDEELWEALENWVTYWAPQYSELSQKPARSDDRATWQYLGVLEYEDHQEDEDADVEEDSNFFRKYREDL